MLTYSKIKEITFPYNELPSNLKLKYNFEITTQDAMISALKIGETYINIHPLSKSDILNPLDRYSFTSICNIFSPENIYDFALCLALYNSQNINNDAIRKILNKSQNKFVPKEYSSLLKDTFGWVFWDYQFENILRLFTLDRDLPSQILTKYNISREKIIDKYNNDWTIDDKNIFISIEENMAQPKVVYRLLMKPAWEIIQAMEQ